MTTKLEKLEERTNKMVEGLEEMIIKLDENVTAMQKKFLDLSRRTEAQKVQTLALMNTVQEAFALEASAVSVTEDDTEDQKEDDRDIRDDINQRKLRGFSYRNDSHRDNVNSGAKTYYFGKNGRCTGYYQWGKWHAEEPPKPKQLETIDLTRYEDRKDYCADKGAEWKKKPFPSGEEK
jgi:hypothetical protein